MNPLSYEKNIFSIFYTLVHIFFFFLLKIYSAYYFTSTYRYLPLFSLWLHGIPLWECFSHSDSTCWWTFCDYKKFNFSVHFWRCNSSKTSRSQIIGSKNQCTYSFFEYFQISHYMECAFCILASKRVRVAILKSLAYRSCT